MLGSVPHVEAGTTVPHAHLAFLDGNNIREAAQHPGPICKHRNFWLITAVQRANDHALKTTSGYKSCLVFPVLMVISILFSTCKLRKWPSDSVFNSLPTYCTHSAHSYTWSTSVGLLSHLRTHCVIFMAISSPSPMSLSSSKLKAGEQL